MKKIFALPIFSGILLTSTITIADQTIPALQTPVDRSCQPMIGKWKCKWDDHAITVDTYSNTASGNVELTSVDLGQTNSIVFDGTDHLTTSPVGGVQDAVVNSTLTCANNTFTGVVTLKFIYNGQPGKFIINMNDGVVNGSRMSMKQVSQNYNVIDGVDVPFDMPIPNTLDCVKQ